MLSIVIPTFNEEDYLPRLLRSLQEQGLPDFEIIVADAHSNDKTREIAQEFGCRVVEGGMPSRGRNAGAQVAQGDLILFCDADIAFEKGALKKYLDEFQMEHLDIACFLLKPFGSSRWLKFLYDVFHNIPVLLLEKISQNGGGPILIKRSLHQKIGGFDEDVVMGEDDIYVRKAARHGKFKYIRKPKVFYSQRRFQESGWVRTYIKYILNELYMLFIGPVKTDILHYKFGHKKVSPSETKDR